MIFLCLVIIVGQLDKNARAYSLRATDKLLTNICIPPRNGENRLDMLVRVSPSQGHSAAGASKFEGNLLGNLVSDEANAMLSRLQVCLLFVDISDGRRSVWTKVPYKDHWAFLRIPKSLAVRVCLRVTISARVLDKMIQLLIREEV